MLNNKILLHCFIVVLDSYSVESFGGDNTQNIRSGGWIGVVLGESEGKPYTNGLVMALHKIKSPQTLHKPSCGALPED